MNADIINYAWKDFINKRSCGNSSISEEQHFKFILTELLFSIKKGNQMDKIPEGLNICNLEVLLMPNGEIICEGKTLGWFDKWSKYLTLKDN